MKPYLVLLLVSLQLTLFFVTGNSDSVNVEKRAPRADRLSFVSCSYIKENGFCKYSLMNNTLCYATCFCRNELSPKSCNIVKAKSKCKTSWSITLCRLTCGQCSRTSCRSTVPLGMESKAIPDSRISASSMYDKNHAPARGRLDMKSEGALVGAWCAKANNVHQWIQVDLGEVVKVTGIATQGRQNLNQWVKSYVLQYSLNGSRFTNHKCDKVFSGNTDSNTIVKHALNPPIIARYIRVRPKSWDGHISMRMELYGCI